MNNTYDIIEDDINIMGEYREEYVDYKPPIIFESMFKYLFFDQYLKNDKGSNAIATCTKICDMIIQYDYLWHNHIKKNEINNFINLFTNDVTEYINIISIYDKTELKKYLDKYKYFLLLSGWSSDISGHLINIYIMKENDNYNVVIINSGDGLQYQDNNVMIEFKNINFDQIYLLFRFTYFMKFPDTKLREHILYKIIEKSESTFESTATFESTFEAKPIIDNIDNIAGYFSVEKYIQHNKEISASLYYDHIFDILGKKFHPIKLEKVIPQKSGSCAFYATYYFVKYLLEDNFTEFDMLVKTSLIDEFIEYYTDITKPAKKSTGWPPQPIEEIEYYDDELDSFYGDISVFKICYNISICLIRDNVFDRRDELIEFIINKIKKNNSIFGNYNKREVKTYRETPNIDKLQDIYNKYYNMTGVDKLLEFISVVDEFSYIIHDYYSSFIYIIIYKIISNYFTNNITKITIDSPSYNSYIKFITLFASTFNCSLNSEFINVNGKFKLGDNKLKNLFIFILNSFLNLIDSEIEYKLDVTYAMDNTYINLIKKYFTSFKLFSLKINYVKLINRIIQFRGIIFTKIANSKNILLLNIDNFIIEYNDIDIKVEYINTSRYLNFVALDNIINGINSNTNSNINSNNIFFSLNTNILYQYDYKSKYPEEIEIKTIIFRETLLYETVEINFLYDMLKIIMMKIDIIKFIDSIKYIKIDTINNIILLLNIVNPAIIQSNTIQIITELEANNYNDSICYKMLKNTFYHDLFSFDTSHNGLLEISSNLNLQFPFAILLDYFISLKGDDMKNAIDIIFTTIKTYYVNHDKNNRLQAIIDNKTIIYDDRYNNIVYPIYQDKIYQDKTDKIIYYKTPSHFIKIELTEIPYVDDSGINRVKNRITRNDNNELLIVDDYEFIETVKELYSDFYYILLKLNIIGVNYLIWQKKYKMEYIINLHDIDCIIDIGENGIEFIDKNNNHYEIILDYDNTLLKMWTFYLNNGFIIKTKYGYSLLILISQEYNSRIKDNSEYYWNKNSINFPEFKIDDEREFHENIFNTNYCIIDFHYTLTNFNFTNKDDFMLLFISLVLSKNIIGISLLRNRYLNLNLTSEFDIPYWPLMYKNDNIEYKIRKEFFTRNQFTNTSYTMSEMNDMTEMKLIKKVSNIISKNREKINSSDSILLSFLEKFRSKCNEFDINNTYNDILTSEILDDESEDIIILTNIIESRHIPNINDIYLSFYKYFYTKLIKIKFLKIRDSLSKITAEERKYGCGLILKNIESLDNMIIYNFDKKRNTEDILFEIQSEFFIKTVQKELLNKFTETNVSNCSFEILMGGGKTSVLTPLLLLNKYVNWNKGAFYNIILPPHLVNQSTKIIERYTDVFDNMIIHNNYIQKNHYINIISDAYIKKYALLQNKKTNGFKIFEHKSFTIFDEIDNMINPLKSDLNIPGNTFKLHEYHDTIMDISLIVALDIFNNTVSNLHHIINIKQLPADFKIILEKKLITTINKVNNLEYNKNYGFRYFLKDINFTDLTLLKNYYIAIPYNANNSPVDDSEFTDNELSILLTIISYYKMGLRVEDIMLFIHYIYINYYKNQKESVYIYYYELIEIIGLNTLLILLNCYIIQTHEMFRKECIKLVLYIKENVSKDNTIKIINMYLKQVILINFFKLAESQDNISMVDILNCKNKITFSGTVNFNTPGSIIDKLNIGKDTLLKKIANEQLNKIEADTITQGAIKASILGTTTVKPTIFSFKLDKKTNEGELISFLLANIIKDGKLYYNTLIDCGGLILNTKTIDMVHLINNKINIENNTNTTILYVDNMGNKMVFNKNQDESSNNIYTDMVYDNVFIYYDNKNCIGTDFKQPYIMRGLVTVNSNNSTTEIAQGIFRLRNINIGHTIDFYYINSVPLITCDELYSLLQANEQFFLKNTVSQSKIQCVKYINRYVKKFDKISYNELIYQDTSKYNIRGTIQYTDINSFIKNMIANYRLHMIEDFPISLNTMTSINIQVNMQINIQVNVLVNINKVYNSTDFILYMINMKYNILYLFQPLKNEFKYKGIEGDTLLNIGDYKIKLSKHLLFVLNLQKENNNSNISIINNLYFIVDKTYNIIIITFFEYYLFIQSGLVVENIMICDINNTKVYGETIVIPNIILFLLFNNFFTIKEKKDIIYKLSLIENIDNIILFFEQMFFKNYNMKGIMDIVLPTDKQKVMEGGNYLNLQFKKYIKYKNKFLNLRKQIEEFNIINEDR